MKLIAAAATSTAIVPEHMNRAVNSLDAIVMIKALRDLYWVRAVY